MPSHTASLREGHDFHNQQQLESLWPGASPEIHISPRAAKLAAVVLHELRMFEYTGQLPGGASWSEQPAWRLELWQAYWQAYQAAGDWPELAYPTRDSCDD